MRSCCGVSLWSLLMRTAARDFHPAAPHRNMIVFPQVSSRHAWGMSLVEGDDVDEDEGHWIERQMAAACFYENFNVFIETKTPKR